MDADICRKGSNMNMAKRINQRLHSLPLRAHLLLMALLLALPAVALIIHSGMSQHQSALRRGFSEARRFVNLIATEQYNLTGNVEQLLTTLEQLPEVERHDTAATSSILSSLIKKNTQFANIIIADRHGTVWASALPMGEPFSVAHRRSFQQAVQTRRFSSGDYGVGHVSHKPTIGFGYPILDDKGALLGVILANIDFQHVDKLFHISGLPGGSSFSIIDRNGFIVARNLDPATYVGTQLRKEMFLKMQKGPERDTFIAADLSNVDKVISYRKMTLRGENEPYLYVRAAFPKEKVLEEARRAVIVNIALLSSVLAAAILSVIFLGDIFFVKRIHRLRDAALRLAEGDLEARVRDAAQGGEIGELAEVFDHMAGKLAARQATLMKREYDLHVLNQNLTKRVEEETERRLHHERLLARHARLVAMGQMIGAIAHQWRQPLATLGVAVQSIRLAWEHGCMDEEFLKKAEEDCRKQLVYMSDTIEDFRNFFTPDKVAERFGIREKIEEVMMLVSPQFAHSGVALKSLDLSGGASLQLVGYQNEFTQSLLNLVSNAFDAIVEKGEDGGEVTIVTTVAGDRIGVEVRDNGCGIPPEHAEKVFAPYFTTKSGDKGTGIGLYMTKLIIEESMGGTLSFTSTPEGTTFRIELSPRQAVSEVADGR